MNKTRAWHQTHPTTEFLDGQDALPQEAFPDKIHRAQTKKEKDMRKKMKTQARQGDVLLTKVRELPPEANEVAGLILAYGEVTGHAHRVEEVEGVSRFEVQEIRNGVTRRIQYLVNKTNREVKQLHEEHKMLLIPPGVWRVDIQEEYAPQAYRRVAD